MTLSPPLAARVRRLIPLLSSPNDGEVLATRNAIGRELLAGGADWHGLAASIGGPDRPPAPSADRHPAANFGDLARACRDLDEGRLSDRERAFVGEMCRRGFGFDPSPRQRSWMSDLYQRLAARRAAA